MVYVTLFAINNLKIFFANKALNNKNITRQKNNKTLYINLNF